MLHPLSLTGQATAPAGPSVPDDGSPPAARKRRGNPDLNLAPRCGARTRAGCPCRAPAIRGKLRCRMHGGRSTGPRTAEGRARIAAARTRYSPEWRAREHYFRSFARRGWVYCAAVDNLELLPPDLVARLQGHPPELQMPPWPDGGMTVAEERAMQQAEAEALAPWKAAIALVRQVRRGRRSVAVGASGETAHAPVAVNDSPAVPREVHADVAVRPLAPVRALDPGAPAGVSAAGACSAAAQAKAHAPVVLPREPTALRPGQGDFATRAHAPERARDPAAAVAVARSAAASAVAASAVAAKAHAPERAAIGTAMPAPSPGAAVRTPAKAHAPEVVAGGAAPMSPVASGEVPAKPHAPEAGAGGGIADPETSPAAPAQSAAKAHAPAQAMAAASGGSAAAAPNRAARRWMRKQERLRERRVAGGR